MKRFLVQLLFSVAVLGGSGALFVVLTSLRKEPEPADLKQPVPLVEVMTVEKRPLTFTVSTQGTVQPRSATVLLPEVAGRVTRVSPALFAGGFFQEGDVLLEIDPNDYESAVVAAEAALAQAQMALATEEAQAEQARRDWDRLGQGEASALTLREPQLREKQAMTKSAESALERARRDLSRTQVTAPYDGMVRAKHIDVGQYVSPATQLAEVFAVDYAEVRLPVSADEIAYLELPYLFRQDHSGQDLFAEGPAVELTARLAGREHVWEGYLCRTEGTIDARSRLIYAVAAVPDPYGQETAGEAGLPLKVGLFVEAKIQGLEVPAAVKLPRHVLRGPGEILVVTADNRLERREVEVLRTDEAHVYIGDGLEDGERISLTALEFIVDGMEVEPVGPDGESLSEAAPGAEQAASPVARKADEGGAAEPEKPEGAVLTSAEAQG